MGVAAADFRDDSMLELRDNLLRHLQQAGVRGIRGAGLTNVGGVEHLLLLVDAASARGMPRVFQGVPVTVRVTGRAKA